MGDWNNEHNAAYSLNTLSIINFAYPREPIKIMFLFSLFYPILVVSGEVVARRGGPQAPSGIFEFEVLGVGMVAAEIELNRRESCPQLDRIRVGV